MDKKARQHAQKPEADKDREVRRRASRVEGPSFAAAQAPVLPAILRQADEAPDTVSPSQMATLQSAIGMRQAARLTAEAAPVGKAAERAPANGAERQASLQRMLASPAHARVQLKLLVGPAGDAYEQEADRVAASVLSMPTPLGSAADRGGGAVQLAEEEEVQTSRPAGSALEGSFEAGEAIEQRLASLKGGGSPLPAETRDFVEPRFSADFGSVRLHTGSEAADLNQALGAQAFTHGSDIYMGAGAPAPESTAGRHLLAHELTHTLQQGAVHRLRRWLPLGHSMITQKVLEDDPILAKNYDEDAKQYLVVRAPDVDFIQDETNAMEKGIAESAPKIKKFKALLKKRDEQSMAEAQRMWNNNELHIRPQWYVLHHGEGGQYREGMSSAAAKNRAMTDMMVGKAAEVYKSGANEAGLSVLSDALHQAEDRGSHEEGTEFHGHDIRQTISPQTIKGKKKGKWPAGFTVPPEGYYKAYPQPDNAEVNTEGAKYGLKYADDALVDFLTQMDALPVTLGEGNKGPQQRKTKVAQKTLSTSTGKAGMRLATAWKKMTMKPLHTGKKGITGVGYDEWMNIIEKGSRPVEEQIEEGSQQELSVTASMWRFLDGWITAELESRIRENVPSGRYDRSRTETIAKKALAAMMTDYAAMFVHVPQDMLETKKTEWVKHAVDNYEYQKTKFVGTQPEALTEAWDEVPKPEEEPQPEEKRKPGPRTEEARDIVAAVMCGDAGLIHTWLMTQMPLYSPQDWQEFMGALDEKGRQAIHDYLVQECTEGLLEKLRKVMPPELIQ